MKTKLPYKILMFLGVFMLLGLTAEAQTSVETSLYGSSNPNQNAIQVDVGAEVGNSGDATTTEGDPDRPMTDNNSSENESDSEFLGTSTIYIKAVEVRGWDSKQKEEFLANVKTEAEVRSDQDLENFARGILLKDDNVVSVSIEEEETRLTYKLPAYLFGTFDSSLKTHVRAHTRGEIKVRYPWYGFLYKKLVSPDELLVEIEATLPEVNDEVVVNSELRAVVLQNLTNVLRTRHDVAMSIVANVR